MKKPIILLLLIPMFCKAQSPDDHVVYPDTSLVIGTYIHTIDDRGDLSTKVLGVMKSIDMHLDSPTEYFNYLEQNKPAMKKFEYKKEYISQMNTIDELNRSGFLGWELVGIIEQSFDSTDIFIFKREIQER